MTADLRRVDPEFGVSLFQQWVPAPRYLLRRDRILAHLVTRAPGALVEVGCGAGALLFDLVKRGFACTGLEQSAEALEVARRVHCDTGVVLTSTAGAWAQSFDTLISCEVLEHIDDDVGALREWVGWLKPGGLAILSVPAHTAMWGPHDVWAGHVRRYGRADFERLARAAGLNVMITECYGFPVANITHRLRNLRMRNNTAGTTTTNTARSGVDRSVEVKLYGAQTSRLGRLTLRTAMKTQRRFLSTDLGEGYLIVATKPG
ncbi:MAG: class I SAM-dependent methyltransferase [Deltaproteobacteria bacterium]|nr:class I SAM-dependent methyltransferase [Deltaproteobacteria bacterium]